MNFNKKTKIIATIGPSCSDEKEIKKLIKIGVDIFRFNTKHSTITWHEENIKKIQKISEKAKKNIGIMIDLQGSETRIKTKQEKEIKIKKNDNIFISYIFSSNKIDLIIPNKKLIIQSKKNDNIFIDDGKIKLKIIKKNNGILETKVITGNSIKNNKGVVFNNIKDNPPSLTKKDLEFLNLIFKYKINFIALSFVNSKDDVLLLKNEMRKRKIRAMIISKIEGKGAIKNIDNIIENSDAIMVARGDLGIEVPIQEIAYWQKIIIDKSREKNVPVIVATQMLHSMIENIIPTRAEVTDVANAVFNGADALMLSEETAAGKNPINSVATMLKIVKFNEKKSYFPDLKNNPKNLTEFLVTAIKNELNKNNQKIKTTIIFTESGYTARTLSSFRPDIKIVAITNNFNTYKQLSLSYGVYPILDSSELKNLELPFKITEKLKKEKIISKKEIVAVFHGKHKKKPMLLNLFSITKIK